MKNEGRNKYREGKERKEGKGNVKRK